MTVQPIASPLSIPPLENGDRLTQPEFARRYQAMPRGVKAELVEGVVYMASPLRIKSHGEPHGNLIGWLWTYKVANPGLVLGVEPTVRLDGQNEVQPDAVLFVPGRQATIDAEDYIQGSPELIAEVAASSAAYDLHDKKQAYCRNGVQEYLVWQVLEQHLDWFSLQAGEYVPLEPDAQGILRSQVFPGLWLDRPAVLRGDMAQVVVTLHQGLSTQTPSFSSSPR